MTLILLGFQLLLTHHDYDSNDYRLLSARFKWKMFGLVIHVSPSIYRMDIYKHVPPIKTHTNEFRFCVARIGRTG